MIPNVRPITEDEKPLAEALYRNTFKIDKETSQRWLKLTDLSDTRAILDDTRVLSMLVILPLKIWIGGRQMAMGGISGVATWADQQGKGYAGLLVRNAIADMRDRGESVSILYPFSFPFYSRFGYELVNHYTSYSATPAEFASPVVDEGIQIRAASLPEDLAEIQECYRRIAPRWNTMLDRDNSHWNTRQERDKTRWERWLEHWSADKRQVYLVDSVDHKSIVGYFAVMDNPLPDGGFESTVTELMFESDEHLNALARFCHRLPVNVKKVKVVAAPKPCLWHLFREPRVTTQVNACYQARVVDLEKACRERGYRAMVNANVQFSIKDDCAAWNSGAWNLQVKEGRGEVLKINAEGGDDILLLSIQDFSAIFTGYKPASSLAAKYPQHVGALQVLDEIFHDHETRLLDFF